MTIHTGDCVEVMAGMDAASVDAVVTDPPYGLEFMGKEWDRLDGAGFHAPKDEGRTFTNASGHMFDNLKALPRFGSVHKAEAFHARWATEAFRVAKPGAYLLAFGGTRTYHRMTCAIEDAGWIIRDCLVWAYASGFPKSRALLKPAWEPIVMARKPGPLRELAIDACRIGMSDDDRAASEAEMSGASAWRRARQQGAATIDVGTGEMAMHPSGRWPANLILTDPIFDGDTPGVVGGGEAASGIAVTRNGGGGKWYDQRLGSAILPDSGYGDTGTYSRFFELSRRGMISACSNCGAPIAVQPSRTSQATTVVTAPSNAAMLLHESSGQDVSDAASPSLWDATATAPSPAPMERDGTAVSTANAVSDPTASDTNVTGPNISPVPQPVTAFLSATSASPAGQSPTSIATMMTTASPWLCEPCAEGVTLGNIQPPPQLIGRVLLPVEEPDYPRFYLCPKADRAEREPVLGGLPSRVVSVWGGDEDDLTPGKKSTIARRNVHPTVKPLDLMRHLVRLVTPASGLVLDPFLGSGTTALAAEMEGFRWLGIEKEPEYVAIAEARLNGTQRGLGLVDEPVAV